MVHSDSKKSNKKICAILVPSGKPLVGSGFRVTIHDREYSVFEAGEGIDASRRLGQGYRLLIEEDLPAKIQKRKRRLLRPIDLGDSYASISTLGAADLPAIRKQIAESNSPAGQRRREEAAQRFLDRKPCLHPYEWQDRRPADGWLDECCPCGECENCRDCGNEPNREIIAAFDAAMKAAAAGDPKITILSCGAKPKKTTKTPRRTEAIPAEEIAAVLERLGYSDRPFGNPNCWNPWHGLWRVRDGKGRDGSQRKNVGAIQERKSRCGRCSGEKFCHGCWAARRAEILGEQAALAHRATLCGLQPLYQIRFDGTDAKKKKRLAALKKQAVKDAKRQGLPRPGGSVLKLGDDWVVTSTVNAYGTMTPVSFLDFVAQTKATLAAIRQNIGRGVSIVTTWGAWYGLRAEKQEPYLQYIGRSKLTTTELTELAVQLTLSWHELAVGGYWLYVREFAAMAEWKEAEFVARSTSCGTCSGYTARRGSQGGDLSRFDDDFSPVEPPDEPQRRWGG